MRQFTTLDAKLTYTNLRAQTGSHYEVLVRRGNTEYGMNELISVDIQAAAIEESGPSVGGVHSTQCDLSLYKTNPEWPRMASFTVFLRLTDADGNAHSEYIPMGTFYTDQRNDKVSGRLSIVAFDGMLKMEQSWTDKIVLPSVWPVTARDWATRIQNAHLAKFADLTQLDNETAFIGLNTASTIRDILKDIAAIHGGNWQMVTRITNQSTFAVEEELTLIPLVNKQTEDINIGQSVKDLTKSPALPAIKKVRIESEDGTEVHAETQDAEYTDYQLQCTAEFASNVGIAALCLGRVSGYVYLPFTANGTQLDPIVEIGDAVKINGVIYQLMSADWKINTWPTANISAPYDEEVDHEYQMLSPQAKTLRKALAATNEVASTVISQTSQQIQLLASSIGDEITNLQNQIDGNIQSWSGNEVPTNDNYPVTSWEDDPSEHVGDVYLVNIDAGIPQAGQYYRFVDNNGVYSWELLSDSALTEALTQAAAALAAANDAQTTAGLKGRIWITRPTPPYSAGDLWFNSTVVGEADILTCTNTRSTGNFVQGDWWKLNKYIDNSGLADFLATSSIIQEIESQLDRKAETYYQATDPAASWTDPTTGQRIAFVVGVSAVGVDRLGLSGNASEHAGDLWYKTDNNTTWYFDGTQWRQQDVPDDVFDKIDGKAQIFISRPYPPYHEGDLWFDSETSGIMTCVRTRLEGNYVDSDWQERNKYTDDTTANLVKNELTSELNIQAGEISARVTKTGGSSSSFGWSLTSDAHTWYSNGKTVMKINQLGGLSVTGSITALSGTIGDCEIADGRLVVGVSNLSTKVVTFSFTELQYYLSESSETKRGGNWSTDVPDWQDNHYYWTRTHTRTDYSDHSVEDSYSPSVEGKYNQSLTELIAKTQNAAVANDSTKRQQTLFFSAPGGTLPNPIKPTAWVNEVEGVNVETNQQTGIKYGKHNVWTPIRPLYNSRYPAVYYVTQSEKADATITCTDPRLDATTTIIDGNNIITGSINADKLAVSELSALRATIGGFTIRSSTSQQGVTTGSIAYGKTSIGDSNAGVYIGTNGISLGADNVFKVTDTGAVTASNLSLTGGTISIKKTVDGVQQNVFSVSTEGAINANFENGTLTIGNKMRLTSNGNNSSLTIGGFTIGNGAIYTNGQDDYDDEDPGAGVHLSSYGIRLGANFSVDSNGNLYAESGYFNGTIYAENLQGLVTQEQLAQAIQNSLSYANNYHAVTTTSSPSSSEVPNYFRARDITATRYMTASDYYVEVDQSNSYRLKGHYHSINVDESTGRVTIGAPYNDTSAPFFNIADTAYFRREVSAVTVDSLSITTTYNSNTHTYGISCTAYNADNDSLKTRGTATGTEAYNAGQSSVVFSSANSVVYSGEYDFNPTVSNARASYSGGYLYGAVNVTLSNSKVATIYVGIDGTKAYNSGYSSGESAGASSVVASSVSAVTYSGEYDFNPTVADSRTNYSGGYLYGAVNVTLNNSKTYTVYVKMDGAKAYNAGAASDSIGIYTPLNDNNPYESTATDKWFTIASGSNQETVEIYTQYDSQTKKDNVKYSTSTGGYPNGTLFSFARKDIGVRSTITANGTYYASNDNLDGYSAVTVKVSTSGGVVTSITRYYGEIDVSSLGNSFDFSDQSGTHTYQFTYDDDSHSYHDITFPDSGGGGGESIGVISIERARSDYTGEIEEPYTYQGDYYVDAAIFNDNTRLTTKKLYVDDVWHLGYSQGVIDAGGGGGEDHEIAYQGGYNSSTHKYYLTVWCRGGGAQVTFYSNSAIT